jgi:hypothetical protein
MGCARKLPQGSRVCVDIAIVVVVVRGLTLEIHHEHLSGLHH